ncbi:MAG: hypothetical protein NTZ46_12065 [Verrucomicrobia bacterium]|nr:hypothetical protein [Verrucomicrobiota bacterium]
MDPSKVHILWENRHEIKNGVYTDSTTTYNGATMLDVAEAEGASQLKKELHDGTLDIETAKEASKVWALAAGLHFDNYDNPSFLAIDVAACDMTRSCFVSELQNKGDFWESLPKSIRDFFERCSNEPVFSAAIERAEIFKCLQREGKFSEEWMAFLYRAITRDKPPTSETSRSETRSSFDLPPNYVSCGISTRGPSELYREVSDESKHAQNKENSPQKTHGCLATLVSVGTVFLVLLLALSIKTGNPELAIYKIAEMLIPLGIFILAAVAHEGYLVAAVIAVAYLCWPEYYNDFRLHGMDADRSDGLAAAASLAEAVALGLLFFVGRQIWKKIYQWNRNAVVAHQETQRVDMPKEIPKYPWIIRRNSIKIIACGLVLIGFTDIPVNTSYFQSAQDEQWLKYFQVVRWAVFAAALCGLWENAQSARSEGWKTFWGFFFGIMAILFNPVLRFHFERATWQPIDFIALIGIALSFFKSKTKINTMKTILSLLSLVILSGCTNAGPFVTNISSDGHGNLVVEKNTVHMNAFMGTISNNDQTSIQTIRVNP